MYLPAFLRITEVHGHATSKAIVSVLVTSADVTREKMGMTAMG